MSEQMPLREEQVVLPLPMTAGAICLAVEVFKQQFGSECHVYCQGHVTIETGELCEIVGWARVGCPGDELDLLGIGGVEGDEEEEALAWVCPTQACRLLLSTHPLASHERSG